MKIRYFSNKISSSQISPVALAIESIKKNRRGVTLGKNLSLKKLIEEGRAPKDNIPRQSILLLKNQIMSCKDNEN